MKKRFDLGILAGYLLPMTGGNVAVEEKQFVGVKAGKIAFVGPFKPALKKESKKFIDASSMAVLPGFVNGHTHLPMTLFRGLEDDVPFHVWLFERILPLEGQLVSGPFVKDGTELAALECIRFGVTTVNEMYFYAGETAKVIDRAGLRAIIAQTLADFPLPEDKDLGTDKFKIVRDLRKKYKNHSRIEIGFGPHAPYSCGDDLLRRVAKEAAELEAPIHIHVSETKKEVEDSIEKYGETPVERLKKLGVLRPRTICAHCVHLSDSDRDIFHKCGASAVYNPDSNAKLNSGIAPVADYLRRGIPVAFGTDGAASNNDLSLFGAMDLGTKLQKLGSNDTLALTARDALFAATMGGAKALGLDAVIGSLEEGKSADIVIIDLAFPHLQPVNDLVSHLVYSAQGLEVDTVMVEGKILLEGKKFRTLNEKTVFKRAAVWQKKVQANLRKLK